MSNLDANLRRSMRDKIRELQKQFDITSLYVTHDQSEAFAVSDTVLGAMKQGTHHADRLTAGSLPPARLPLYGELYGRCQPVPGNLQRRIR
ncbi:hypothetical protein ACLB1O_31850 [Escherichia coli]